MKLKNLVLCAILLVLGVACNQSGSDTTAGGTNTTTSTNH